MIQLPSLRAEYQLWVSVTKPLLVSQAQAVSCLDRGPLRGPDVGGETKLGVFGSLEEGGKVKVYG